MKKLSIIIYVVLALFFVSCKNGDTKDANGDTPSTVVDKMYQAIKANNFAEAVSYNKIPDTVRIPVKNKNIYEGFKNCPVEQGKKNDGTDVYIIAKEEWEEFLLSMIQQQYLNASLESWQIIDENISKTDPNSAKVKTKITIKIKDGSSKERECSFPLKRENGKWLIIG